MTIAIEKMIEIGVSLVSKCSTSGSLKTLNAYTWPIERWTASAAGGISHRRYPGGAIVRSRSSMDSTALSPSVDPLLGGLIPRGAGC